MTTVYFEDLAVGDSWDSRELAVDGDEMLAYSRAYDPWPMHVDAEAAKSAFGGVIASGGYTIALAYRLGHQIYNQPDHRWAFQAGYDWHAQFLEPLRAGDRLRLRITIIEKKASGKPGRGIFKTRNELINHRDRIVLSVDSTMLIATRPLPAG